MEPLPVVGATNVNVKYSGQTRKLVLLDWQQITMLPVQVCRNLRVSGMSLNSLLVLGSFFVLENTCQDKSVFTVIAFSTCNTSSGECSKYSCILELVVIDLQESLKDSDATS